MIIVAISDTHVSCIEQLPPALLDNMKEADMIIHAGDYVSMAVLDQLKKFRSFRGVRGNMDPPEIKLDLPEEITFDLAGCRIGRAHPAQGGPPSGIQNALITRLEGVDLVVYGHTHKAKTERKGKVLFVNPGSATGVQPARAKTFAVIDLDGTVQADIVEIHQMGQKERTR